MFFSGKKGEGSGGGDLPEQDELRTALLRPGRQVDLILDTDLNEDRIDVRSSILHEVTPQGFLVLGQPVRGLGPSRLGSELEVTFLFRQFGRRDEDWLRVGYRARLLKILGNFRLADGSAENAILVSGPEKLGPSTVRLHYRLVPPLDFDVRLKIGKKVYSILDLSVGGVKIAHAAAESFSPGQRLEVEIVSRDTVLGLVGEVVRQSLEPEPGNRTRGVTALRFLSLPLALQSRLGRLINDMTRHLLAKRSGMFDE
ncbi:MAG: PilZ domain-containing protein [Deltaproteobacteria bacterium]|nr:PilZ domain-containing protein [Deltaproteobacteria bacterium]